MKRPLRSGLLFWSPVDADRQLTESSTAAAVALMSRPTPRTVLAQAETRRAQMRMATGASLDGVMDGISLTL